MVFLSCFFYVVCSNRGILVPRVDFNVLIIYHSLFYVIQTINIYVFWTINRVHSFERLLDYIMFTIRDLKHPTPMYSDDLYGVNFTMLLKLEMFDDLYGFNFKFL